MNVGNDGIEKGLVAARRQTSVCLKGGFFVVRHSCSRTEKATLFWTCIKIAKEGWRVHTVMPIMWPAESQAVGPFAVDGEADLDIKILFERKLT